jgi:hypothetical protein
MAGCMVIHVAEPRKMWTNDYESGLRKLPDVLQVIVKGCLARPQLETVDTVMLPLYDDGPESPRATSTATSGVTPHLSEAHVRDIPAAASAPPADALVPEWVTGDDGFPRGSYDEQRHPSH